jgi:hypothetical protein
VTYHVFETLRDRRSLAVVLALLGLGALLAYRRRGGEGGSAVTDDESDPEDIMDQLEELDSEELSIGIDDDVGTDIGTVETDPDAAVEPLDDGGEEFSIDPEELSLPDDEPFGDLLEEVMDGAEELPADDIRSAIQAEFESAEIDEELLSEVQSTLTDDGPTTVADGDPEVGDDDGTPAVDTRELDLVDYLAVVVAGLDAAREVYRDRTDGSA